MNMDDDSSNDQHLQVIKDFDFLDIELDEMEVSRNCYCCKTSRKPWKKLGNSSKMGKS